MLDAGKLHVQFVRRTEASARAIERASSDPTVMKRGNARGAKGAGHRHCDRDNRQREEPDFKWKAAAFARWHEPDDVRMSSPDLLEARGEIHRGLLGSRILVG